MTRHDDTVALRHMLDYAQTARRLTAGRKRDDLDADEMLHLALARAVEVIGEAATRVSDATRQANPNIPWSQITGTRNRLIHGYDRVNFDILWRIVNDELPPLIAQLEVILSDESRAGS
jgi:uncharacterized protein with HEPN domain